MVKAGGRRLPAGASGRRLPAKARPEKALGGGRQEKAPGEGSAREGSLQRLAGEGSRRRPAGEGSRRRLVGPLLGDLAHMNMVCPNIIKPPSAMCGQCTVLCKREKKLAPANERKQASAFSLLSSPSQNPLRSVLPSKSKSKPSHFLPPSLFYSSSIPHHDPSSSSWHQYPSFDFVASCLPRQRGTTPARRARRPD